MQAVPKPNLVPPPLPPVDPATTFVDVVVVLLGSLFGSGIFSGTSSATASALTTLRDNLTSAIDAVKRFAWAIGRGLGFIFTAIGQMLASLLPDILNALRKLARILKDVYSKIIVPALNALQKIRGMLNDLYNNWIRPLIIMLQRVRQFLAILKALHISWAGKLDARLAQIESYITAPFLWLVQQLNGIGGWLNIILTTRATIQRVIFRRSLLENMGSLTGLWWATQTSAESTAAVNSGPAPTTVADAVTARFNFIAYVQSGFGPVADRANRALAVANTKYPAI